MERSLKEEEEEKGESGDELQQQLKHLEDWNSLKQSNPGRLQVQHCWATPHSSVRSADAAASILEQLEDKSPRDLIYSIEQITHLQGDESGGVWKVRNNDLVVEEILSERKAAIESGKLKGRRLFDFDFDTLQDGSTRDLDFNIRWGSEDRCSTGRSSVLIQGSEVRSMCSSSSSDTDEDDGGSHDLHHHSSSSSVSALKVESSKMVRSLDGKRHIWRGGGGGSRERGMLLMIGYLAIFVMIFVLGIISLKSFEGFGDQQSSFDSLIPT